MTRSIHQELDRLHTSYIQSVNDAVAAGDGDLAADLAAAYDVEAAELAAAHERQPALAPLAAQGLARALSRSEDDLVVRRQRLTHAYSQAIEVALAREDDALASRLGAQYDRRANRLRVREDGRGRFQRLLFGDHDAA